MTQGPFNCSKSARGLTRCTGKHVEEHTRRNKTQMYAVRSSRLDHALITRWRWLMWKCGESSDANARTKDDDDSESVCGSVVYSKAFAKQGQTTLLPLWSVEARHSSRAIVSLHRAQMDGRNGLSSRSLMTRFPWCLTCTITRF